MEPADVYPQHEKRITDKHRSTLVTLALIALGMLAVVALVVGLVIMNIESDAPGDGRVGVEDCRG